MKKLFLIPVYVLLLITSNSFAQGSLEKKGWPSSERYAFISECIKTASVNLSQDTARFYCYCMQAKVEEAYPTSEEAGKISNEDLSTPEWQKKIKACLTGTWSAEYRETFLSNCIESAVKGKLEENKAKNYCECMLFKIESKMQNPEDASKLTPELLATPEWKKILKGCLEF